MKRKQNWSDWDETSKPNDLIVFNRNVRERKIGEKSSGNWVVIWRQENVIRTTDVGSATLLFIPPIWFGECGHWPLVSSHACVGVVDVGSAMCNSSMEFAFRVSAEQMERPQIQYKVIVQQIQLEFSLHFDFCERNKQKSIFNSILYRVTYH